MFQARTREGQAMTEKPSATLSGTVEMTIESIIPSEPEKAQITFGGADHPHKIRIENKLTDENGEQYRLKPGAKVQITVRNGGLD
jgi:hypothetical protein